MSKPRQTIPSSKVARATVVGVTAAKISAKKLSLLSIRPFVSTESFERRRAQADDDIAAALFHGLSTLRGSALKVAQMMSLESIMWPKASQKEFHKSQYRVPPLNRAVVRRLMMSEFGQPPEDIFNTFDTTAFAAASLGQVHRATSFTGERLAVKVQYPGVDRAMMNDMHVVRQFLVPFSRMKHLSYAMEEIERRFSEEVNYDLERRTTKWFYEHVRMPGIVIPRPYDEYSSALVLTTEFLDGMHLDEWLKVNPSQQERDRAAQLMYDFFIHSLFGMHKIHSDPNPGNYLFRNDGTIAIIDFGSVKVFSPSFCKGLLALLRAHLRNDHDSVVSLYCSMGLAHGNEKRVSQSCKTALTQLGDWMSLPYQEEVFDFGKDAEFLSCGGKFIRNALLLEEMHGFTSDAVLFDRTIYGLFCIFTKLRARVRMQNQWLY